MRGTECDSQVIEWIRGRLRKESFAVVHTHEWGEWCGLHQTHIRIVGVFHITIEVDFKTRVCGTCGKVDVKQVAARWIE